MLNPFSGILLRPSTSTHIEVFSNADWAGDVSDRRSHGSLIVYFGGNLISWQSKKQLTVARSSTKAKYRSLADATSEGLRVSKVLLELGISATSPMTV